MILRRGDEIHLAVPLTPGLSKEEGRVEALETMRELEKGYNAMGVNIRVFSAHATVTHSVVVAVFRHDDA